MSLIKNSKKSQAQMPLDYEEACRRYAAWCERELAKEGVIPIGTDTPSRWLSEVVGSTWHLTNVNGLLAKVEANGRVWGPRTESENPEVVIAEYPNWVPADQIPAVVETLLNGVSLPCGCPVDPLEIEDARASLIEEARVAACDDRDDGCEILEGGPIDSENRSPAGIELRANPAPLSTTGGCTFPEYVPDEWDWETLAWAYLDEGIGFELHTFTTGWSGKARHYFERFELIAKHLGESKRREIIDAMDNHQARHRGDDWQVFKAWCKPGFWRKPADRAAIVRVAESILEQLSDRDAGCYGREYLEFLRDARRKQKMNDEQTTAGDADDETSRYEKINCRELRAELDAPNEVDELFRAAADLEHLGLVEDAKRIRESVSALVRKMRRKWLMHSNYIPWGSDEEWVESSNVIPEEMDDHPEFLDGQRALLSEVERVRADHFGAAVLVDTAK